MNKILLISLVFLSMSCTTKSLFVENHTGREIQHLVFLSKDDVSNLDLDYDEIQEKNILIEPLLPKKSIELSKKIENPYCIYYEDTDYQSYMDCSPIKNRIYLSASSKLEYSPLEAMFQKMSNVSIKIHNASKYNIQYIIINSDDYPETYHTLSPWNIIPPDGHREYEFNGFKTGNSIKSITVIGYKDGRKVSKVFTENLDELLRFTAN